MHPLHLLAEVLKVRGKHSKGGRSTNLNQYKIPMTLTLSPMFLRTASRFMTYDIPLDSALNGGGHRLLKTSDMCSGCPTGSTSVFRAGGEEIVGVMQFGRIMINR